jgi:hypothetical protein
MPVGTKSPGTLFVDLKKKFPNLRVVPNFYGMTEFGRTIAYSMDTRDKSYKTFYVRNLQMLVMS